MEKEFVPYKLAVKLKELGFDELCLAFSYIISEYGYKEHELYLVDSFDELIKNTKHTYYYVRPTYEQAFDWFREKYAYFTSFDYQHDENNGFFYCIINIEDEEFYFPEDFEPTIYKTYEEARLACLEKLIELCEKK